MRTECTSSALHARSASPAARCRAPTPSGRRSRRSRPVPGVVGLRIASRTWCRATARAPAPYCRVPAKRRRHAAHRARVSEVGAGSATSRNAARTEAVPTLTSSPGAVHVTVTVSRPGRERRPAPASAPRRPQHRSQPRRARGTAASAGAAGISPIGLPPALRGRTVITVAARRVQRRSWPRSRTAAGGGVSVVMALGTFESPEMLPASSARPPRSST